MSPRPILSIVIPAYNVERHVAAAVRSALGQTLTELEVIVVDDGSTDRTAAVVRSIADSRLRLLSKPNGGLSSARNAGIAAARADLIGFLDGDDLWLPRKALRHVEAMHADPGVGISFSHSAYIDEVGVPTGRVLLSSRRRPGLSQMIRRNRVGNGSTPVVRRECFVLAGCFDESLRSCEDWEMWVRILRDTSYRAELVPEILTAYRINTQSLSMNIEGFLRGADMAAERINRSASFYERLDARQGLAMCYRIAATKSLGRGAAPRTLLRALAICPWLPFVDPRFLGTFVALLLPMGVTNWAHRVVAAVHATAAASGREKRTPGAGTMEAGERCSPGS